MYLDLSENRVTPYIIINCFMAILHHFQINPNIEMWPFRCWIHPFSLARGSTTSYHPQISAVTLTIQCPKFSYCS